jgi:hypothetical protein
LSAIPKLLRRLGRRRGPRRLVFLSALACLVLAAPGSAAVALNITFTVTGTPGENGWFRGNVTVKWDVVGETWSHPDCSTRTLVVDTSGTKITCTARNDNELTESTKSVTIKLDKTVPTAAPVPGRLADANGWYNRPFTVAFSGTDVTSGIAACTSALYGGPDNLSASVAGSCKDFAGNVTGASFAFKYDATAPTLFSLTTKRGNRSAKLAWRKSADTERVEVLRAPGREGEGETVIYRGPAAGYRDTGLVVGRRYEYRVASIDQAANRSEKRIDFIATGALLSPAPAQRVTAPPILTWTPVKRASYYNVQLVRGRKVLSAWPEHPGFRLPRAWMYDGRRYRLRPGLYRWYVFPGFGRISENRYGRLLGSSTFVVTR